MTLSTPNSHPLRLAIGSHAAGSGKGCAMNLISWENGDTTITDLPACADCRRRSFSGCGCVSPSIRHGR